MVAALMLGVGGAGVGGGLLRFGPATALADKDGDDDDEKDETKQEKKCEKLLAKEARVCPSKPKECEHVKKKLAKYACAVAECPCDFNANASWWYYPQFNGVYCGPATVNGVAGRLSVCSPGGDEICVLNYGTANAVTLDAATCAACRSRFPAAGTEAFTGTPVTINSCVDIQ